MTVPTTPPQKFHLSIWSIILCTAWFIGWMFVMLSRTQAIDANDALIFRQLAGKDGKKVLTTDNIYFNNNFELQASSDKKALKDEIFFNKNPKLLLWYFLIVTLASLSCAFILPLLNKVKWGAQQISNKKLVRGIFWGSLIFCSSIFTIDQGNPLLLSPQKIMSRYHVMLQSPSLTMYTLQAPILIAAILSIAGMLLSTYRIFRLKMDEQNDQDTVSSYRILRSEIGQYLLILGIIVASGSVITTAALRSAINQLFIGNTHMEFMSSDIVYTYSLVLSLFVLVVYVPSFFIMTNKGKEILEKINPFNPGNLQDWSSRQGILEDYLGLKTSLKENITNGLIVIAPIVSGLLSQLIGK